jgi:hypothetical protein
MEGSGEGALVSAAGAGEMDLLQAAIVSASNDSVMMGLNFIVSPSFAGNRCVASASMECIRERPMRPKKLSAASWSDHDSAFLDAASDACNV